MKAVWWRLCSGVFGAFSVAVWLALAGCSASGEDVRVTLCKDLVVQLLPHGSGLLDWTSVEVRERRAEDLTVALGFSVQSGDGAARSMRAACVYRHDAVEDTALTLADPMSAYSTSPRSVTLNGRSIANPQLAEAIKEAMLAQGRDFLERAQRQVEGAARQVGQGLRDLQSHE